VTCPNGTAPGRPSTTASTPGGGFGTKVHLVRDGKGTPLAAVVTPGQRHESTQVEAVLGQVKPGGRRGRPTCRPVKLAGDKG